MPRIDFSRTRLSPTRSLKSYSKVQALWSSLIRNRRMFATVPPKGAYLDVGCGPHVREGYCNLDYLWRPGVHICWDIRNGWPLPDSHIAGLFSEHCLEHISFDDFRFAAKEMHRILMPGARVRIVVPDAELYLRKYMANLAGEGVEMPCSGSDASGGIYTPAMSVNRIMRAHGHQFIYDFQTMKAVLEATGFRDVTKASFGNGADPKLLIDTDWRKSESLYVEAVR